MQYLKRFPPHILSPLKLVSKRGGKKHEFQEMGSNTVRKRREFPGGQVFSRYRKPPVQGGAREQWAPGGMPPRKNKKETQRISDMLFEYVEKKNYTLMKHLVKHVENHANKKCEFFFFFKQKVLLFSITSSQVVLYYRS